MTEAFVLERRESEREMKPLVESFGGHDGARSTCHEPSKGMGPFK